MNHILFLFYLFVGAIGFTVVLITVLAAIKFQNTLLKEYAIFLLLLGMLFFTEQLEFYGALTDISFLSPLSLGSVIIYIVIVFLLSIYYPYFVMRLSGRDFSFKWIVIIVAPLIFYPPGIVLYILGIGRGLISQLSDIIFLMIIGFWTIILLMKDKRSFLKLLSFTILLFIPFLILDISIPFSETSTLPDFISIPFIMFYLIWNIMNLSFGYKYYLISDRKNNYEEKIPQFSKVYQLSNRESEILKQVVNGAGNKVIGFELSISERTVKNHVYNIYQKTEVQTRIELLLKLLNFSSAKID